MFKSYLIVTIYTTETPTYTESYSNLPRITILPKYDNIL